jgi:HD-GYP domain-containing protein (c-di-GMP phosphodiesterase class II)
MARRAGSIDDDLASERRLGAKARRLPLHIHVALLFALLITGVGGAISWRNSIENRQLISSASHELIEAIGGKTVAAFASIDQPVQLLIDLLARHRLVDATNLAQRMDGVSYLADALEHSAALSAVYIGYSNGDFFLVRAFRDNGPARAQFNAPASAAYLVQSIERDPAGRTRGTYVFLDRERRELERRDVPDYVFDPRTRGWYTTARAASRQIRTDPYVFFSTDDVGLSYARHSDVRAGAVAGADLTLRDLSRVLQQQKVTPSSELVLFNADGVTLAYDKPERVRLEGAQPGSARLATVAELGSPVLAHMMDELGAGVQPDQLAFDVAGRGWQGSISQLQVKDDPRGVYLAVLSPRDELFSEARRISRDTWLMTLFIVLISIPVAWLLSRLVATPLRKLVLGARAVREFDFSTPIATRSSVAEVHELAATMDAMKVTIRNFLDIGTAISAERNFQHLLERVLEEMVGATGSAAGRMFLLDDDGRTLRSAADRTGPTVLAAPSGGEFESTYAEHPAWRAISERKTVVARVDPMHDDLTRLYQPHAGEPVERGATVIAVPLRNPQDMILGVICLLKGGTDDAVPRELVSFVEALSGSAAISIENQNLLREQKQLLDSFIKLVAGAIDAKSPYTGGHCQRVPELAKMLATAACEAKQGPFRDFAMSDDEWETLHIAAWLHDCGKVTTPEHVVDKATKLQAIHDRLHEVRMRFEVLKRDAEIQYWRQVASGGDRAALRAALESQWQEIDAEFEFVAECNVGGESMSLEKIARIKRIAERTWLRTLDDRIGLSQEERSRSASTPASPLPVVERVLADKPEHVTERTGVDAAVANEPARFDVQAPRRKRNSGEIYNLCIGRGTLTDEERYIINDHVVQTIRMLSQLPFPRHLKKVPEIAGGHHEKMDGTGYPKRLNGEELSVAARMLAIADVFEALTARDRPYKSGKTLSQAITIMAAMSRDRHIDAALFELFLTSGVYREYAERFIDSAQIDEVDVRMYVAANPVLASA